MSISNLNIQVVGRLGQDAIVRKVQDYNAISFSVAVSEKRKEDQYVTTWMNFTYWTKSDKIANYLTKGKLISVVADWFEITTKEDKTYTNFRVRELNPFLEKNEPTAAQPTGTVANQNPFSEEEDDDLPF